MKAILATVLITAAAALPLGAAQARENVTIRIDTPEFGFRIGTPTRHYAPVPVYRPPVIIAPAPVYVPPRVVHPYPVYEVRHRPYGQYRRWHQWKHYRDVDHRHGGYYRDDDFRRDRYRDHDRR